MSNWYHAGTISIPYGSTAIFSITIDSSVGLTSPSVSTSYATDTTNPSSPTDVSGTVIAGAGASITTALWTTPAITPAAADKTYDIYTMVSDSGSLWGFGLTVVVPNTVTP